jgi:hypothetical protein
MLHQVVYMGSRPEGSTVYHHWTGHLVHVADKTVQWYDGTTTRYGLYGGHEADAGCYTSERLAAALVAGQAVAIAVVARIRGTAPRIPASASGGDANLKDALTSALVQIKKKPNVGTAVPLWLSWLQVRLSAKPGKKPKSCSRCKVPGCTGRGTAFSLLSSFRLCCVTVTSSLIQ